MSLNPYAPPDPVPERPCFGGSRGDFATRLVGGLAYNVLTAATRFR